MLWGGGGGGLGDCDAQGMILIYDVGQFQSARVKRLFNCTTAQGSPKSFTETFSRGLAHCGVCRVCVVSVPLAPKQRLPFCVSTAGLARLFFSHPLLSYASSLVRLHTHLSLLYISSALE